MNCVEIVITAILALNPSWSHSKAKVYADPMCTEAKRRDIDPLIGVAIAWHETGFNQWNRSKNRDNSIDIGLMQFNCPRYPKFWLRKYWCNGWRRRDLISIEGNIKASFQELSIWKRICINKHRYKPFLISSLNSRTSSLCLDCFDISTSLIYIKKFGGTTGRIKRTKKVLNSHWWVRHYNWNRKPYWLSVLYVYKTLLEGRTSNYKLLRNGFYRRLGKTNQLRRCLQTKDLCLGEYEKWQTRLKKRQK